MKVKALFRSLVLVVALFYSCSQKPDHSSSTVKTEGEEVTAPFELFVPTNQDYLGVYLPDRYIEQLKMLRSHSKAIHAPDSTYYNFLAVNPEIIYTDDKWHDGFAIQKKDGERFVFYEEQGSQKIRDENGFSYTQLSKDYQQAYKIIYAFIVKTLFADMILQGSATETEVGIAMQGHDFRVILDDMFYPKSFNALLYDPSQQKVYGATFQGAGAKYNLLVDNKEDIEMLIGPEVELE